MLDQGAAGPPLWLLAVGFALLLWKIISWIIYRSKRDSFDEQIRAGDSGRPSAAPPSPANANATHYSILQIYRPSAFVGSLMPLYIFCDRMAVTMLKDGCYAALAMAPGEHVLSCSASPQSVTLTIEPDTTYFVRSAISGSPQSLQFVEADCAHS